MALRHASTRLVVDRCQEIEKRALWCFCLGERGLCSATMWTMELEVTMDITPQRAPGKPEQVLITGAGGEVGHGLLHAFVDSGGGQVSTLDLAQLPETHASMVKRSYLGDIRDESLVSEIFATTEIDEVYHLAALLSSAAEHAPAVGYDVNVTGSVGMIRQATQAAQQRDQSILFFFPSSIAVYGFSDLAHKTKSGQVDERVFHHPRTMYGCNKLAVENIGRYYALYHGRQGDASSSRPGIDFRCLRFPGLISAATQPTGGTSDFIPEMLHAALRGDPYECFVRPDTRIPFMTMPDAIDATLKYTAASSEQLTKSCYNVSAFNPSAEECVELIKRHYPDMKVDFKVTPERQAIVDSWPESVDCSAARNDWGFNPQHDLEKTFTEYIIPYFESHSGS